MPLSDDRPRLVPPPEVLHVAPLHAHAAADVERAALGVGEALGQAGRRAGPRGPRGDAHGIAGQEVAGHAADGVAATDLRGCN